MWNLLRYESIKLVGNQYQLIQEKKLRVNLIHEVIIFIYLY